MSITNVVCQVGFGYKDDSRYIYYHTRGGKPIGNIIEIGDPNTLPNPFSLDDLVSGRIPYDYLPVSLKNAIEITRISVLTCIQTENPLEYDKLNPDDTEYIFHYVIPLQRDPRILH